MHSAKLPLITAVVIVVLGVVGAVFSGDLNPPATAFKDDGTPASTMKSLEQVGSWSVTIDDPAQRFIVLGGRFMNGAVLDRETGLVWIKHPNTNPMTWTAADDFCRGTGAGNKRGFRLPSIEEFTSVDVLDHNLLANIFDCPSCWSGDGVWFWTATDFADQASFGGNVAYVGVISGPSGIRSKDGTTRGASPIGAWCVRGGSGRQTF